MKISKEDKIAYSIYAAFLTAVISFSGCTKAAVVFDPDTESAVVEVAVESGDSTANVTLNVTPGEDGEPEVEAHVTVPNIIPPVYFDFDSAGLRRDEMVRLLVVAETLKRFPKVAVTIEGHCDERGTNEYNLALGQRRANSVKGYLALLGVDSSRISTISYGEERLKCLIFGVPLPGDNDCHQENRRAEFVVSQ